MRWVDRLERRWGRYTIPNLMNLIILGQVVMWLIIMFVNYELPLALLPLERGALLHGQVWRLVTFLFVPSITTNLFNFAISMYVNWWLGNALAAAWGDFRFQMFIFTGMVGAWCSCLVCGYGGTSGLFLSLFFAYAWMWPDQIILFMFVLPVKVKWLGWASLLVWGMQFLFGTFTTRVSLLFGLAGFLVFFGREVWDWAYGGAVSYKRRRDWQNKWK